MMNRISTLLTILVFPGSLAAQPQGLAPSSLDPASPPIHFEHLTEKDGLSQGCAYAILQDSRGFMWVGTQDGLNRYDGYGFKVYYSGVRDSTSLATGFIMDIAEGRNGILWLGGEEVLTRFDPGTGLFRHFRHDPDDPTTLAYGAVETVMEDRRGGVWAGTQSGLSYLDPESNGTFQRFQHDPTDPGSLSGNFVLNLHEDRVGRIWVLTNRGLNRVIPGPRIRFERYLSPTPDEGSSRDPWSALISVAEVQEDEDALWFGTAAGIMRYEPQTGKQSRFVPGLVSEKGMPVTELVADVENPHVLWAGGRGGFFRFDTRTGTFTPVRHNPTDPRSLPGDIVDAAFADRSGTVWVSASCGGLSRFNTTAARFTLIRMGESDGSNLESLGAGTVLADGTLLVGIRRGDGSTALHHVDRREGTIRSISLDPGYIRAVIENNDGTFWIANRGLLHLDRDLNVIRHYLHDPEEVHSISSNIVASAMVDSEGRIWAGTLAGLDMLDPSTGKFTRFVPGGVPDSVKREDVRAVLSLIESSDGDVWFSTRFALHRLDTETASIESYQHDPYDPRSVNSWIRWIYEHPGEPGVLWLGGIGLARFDARTGEISHFTTADGLPNNTIYGILGDAEGNLWVSTNRGLSRLDPDTGTFMNFGLEHGLQGLEFNEKSVFSAPDGEMFFGGLRGLTAFYPSEITHNPVPPTLVLTDLRLFNQPVAIGEGSPLKVALDLTDEIRLPHDQNHVAFDFVGLHFQNSAKNSYSYQLEGFDDRWIDAGTRREATYANLAPGDYVFRVKAANSDGIWSDAREVRLVVLPPWWQTWWAYLFYAAAAILGLVFIHRFQKERVVRLERERGRERELAQAREIERANRELEARNEQLRLSEGKLERQNQQLEQQNEWIEEQNRKLRELDEVKSRFFANISHEFRTPLTLILAPLNAAVRHGRMLRQEDLPAMRRSARRLLRLINQLLDLSRIDAGAMQLQTKPVDLALMLRRLVASFSSLAERRGISLVYDKPLDEKMAGRVDPDKIEQVVTNLLSNAIKFTHRGGKVRVATRLLDPADSDPSGVPLAEIIVEDTGRGIPPESLSRVFDRFYQVDESATREHEGSGIGLALTRELVELHDGTISVQSKPGFGTSFTVRLPLPPVEPQELAAIDDVDEPVSVPAGGDGFSGPMDEESDVETLRTSSPVRGTVLVVDDNSDMRVYLQRLLRRAGYAVELAEDGVRGQERAIAVRPDLVITDVMMPGMDGYQLCRALKADERLGDIPVVLLTARAAEDDRLEGLGAGADDYLSKPFSPEELKLRLENLILIRRRLRQQYSESVLLGPEEIPITSADASFIEQVRACIERAMGDSQFGVDMLAEEVGLSARQFHRRLKEITGLTPGGYIRLMRLQRAEQLLRQGAGQVAEVAYAVGFSDAKYFSRLFRQTFGCSPSEYTGKHLT